LSNRFGQNQYFPEKSPSVPFRVKKPIFLIRNDTIDFAASMFDVFEDV